MADITAGSFGTGRYAANAGVHSLSNPMYQAYQLLHVAFTVAPIVAGVDKFLHLLVNWDMYLSPLTNRVLAGHGHGFMLLAGVIEIIAGVGVALRPRIFAYIVAAWLVAIIINLLLVPGFFDIALRDLGLALAAVALARLAEVFDRGHMASQSR